MVADIGVKLLEKRERGRLDTGRNGKGRSMTSDPGVVRSWIGVR
jgi:hypothetical protein